MSNSDYVVGRAYGEMAPNQTSIYETLLEKANRDNTELQKENKRLEVFAANIHTELMETRKESEEQARLLGKGSEREARLITERDHYKQALEVISTTIQEYKDSIIQEPIEDFIHAIKAWADKKLKEI